ncbi:MAG: DUF6250 domain-containing protein [Candidatus Latescibacteria bacterium]|jgi:rhamnogalacturonan endolyase|nr:DUF6250 domain-containing protein [Candidatus Latescibacterota bacterium]
MDYRIIERCYGPDIRRNDWAAEGTDLISAGGDLLILAEGDATVTRSDYTHGGGGDVEVQLTFNFERLGDGGSFTVHFNRSREGDGGFRVTMDCQGVTVRYRDRTLSTGDAPSTTRESSHTLKLATLADAFRIHLDGRCLAEGKMDPPGIDNEGWMALEVHNAGVRLLEFEESFIAHEMDDSEWERSDLLYDERFGQKSFRENWVCNGEEPEVSASSFTFRHMGNSILRERFESPIAVDCVATPVLTDRFTARVTDAIFIWMIDRPDGDLFEFMRSLPDAALTHYIPIPLYWVDFGGTNNVTTRFRRNPGRRLIRQFTDRPRLLDRNRAYRITTVQNDSISEFWVDGKRWIQYHDPDPITAGYIGFRAYVADLTVQDLKVWRIRLTPE